MAILNTIVYLIIPVMVIMTKFSLFLESQALRAHYATWIIFIYSKERSGPECIMLLVILIKVII